MSAFSGSHIAACLFEDVRLSSAYQNQTKVYKRRYSDPTPEEEALFSEDLDKLIQRMENILKKHKK